VLELALFQTPVSRSHGRSYLAQCRVCTYGIGACTLYDSFHALHPAACNPGEQIMNQSEQRQLLTLYTYRRMGMLGTVARGLSALVRAARTKRSRDALMEQADILEVIGHPDFII